MSVFCFGKTNRILREMCLLCKERKRILRNMPVLFKERKNLENISVCSRKERDTLTCGLQQPCKRRGEGLWARDHAHIQHCSVHLYLSVHLFQGMYVCVCVYAWPFRIYKDSKTHAPGKTPFGQISHFWCEYQKYREKPQETRGSRSANTRAGLHYSAYIWYEVQKKRKQPEDQGEVDVEEHEWEPHEQPRDGRQQHFESNVPFDLPCCSVFCLLEIR